MKLILKNIFIFFSTMLLLILTGNFAVAQQDVFSKMGAVLPKHEKTAPNFKLLTTNGRSISLSDFKGKTVLLNFWATWCTPCKKELPAMQRLYEDLKLDGFEIVAISIDRDKKERVHKYMEEYSLTFPVLLDPSQKVRKDYFILGLPTSYLIGKDGKLKGFISGAREWDSLAAKQMFHTLIQ